jgi:spoIIIJ-associated protein
VSEDVRPAEVADATVVGAEEDETGRVVTDLGELPDESAPADDRAQTEHPTDDPGQDPTDVSAEDSAAAPADSAEDSAQDPADDSSDSPLDTEAEIAADYLEELLDIADLDGDIDTYIEGDRAHVSVITESVALVGPDGSVLDALQELTRLAVMTETGERSRLMLDVAGFRDKRRGELLTLTTDAVAEARTGAVRVKLSPMNPFERKIVHDAVAAAGLTSESEGEEPARCVVIIP